MTLGTMRAAGEVIEDREGPEGSVAYASMTGMHSARSVDARKTNAYMVADENIATKG